MKKLLNGVFVAFVLLTAFHLGSAQEVTEEDLERPNDYFTDTVAKEALEGEYREGEQRPETVMVKTGERVYCAYCGRKLEDTVHLEEVPLEQAKDFYDDGTHFDEFARDGLPTNVTESRDTYIGPYCTDLKRRLVNYLGKIRRPETWGYYRNAAYPSHWASMAFYGFFASSTDPNSSIRPLWELDAQLSDFVEYFDKLAIEPFRGYTFYEDKLAGPVSPMQGQFLMDPMMEGMWMSPGEGPSSHPTQWKMDRANNAAEMYR